MASNEERGFNEAIEENPADAPSRLVYADWLEDQCRPYEAMLQRVAAGTSEVRYKLRRKSDGQFSEPDRGSALWSAKGKAWESVADLKAHLSFHSNRQRYASDTDWADLEVCVFELRIHPLGALPLTRQERDSNEGAAGSRKRHEVLIQEPKGQGPTS